MAVHGAAEEAREVVTSGARGLTPDGERALIQRVAGTCSQAAERAMAQRSRIAAWRSGALVATGMLLALAGGYWLGLTRPVATELGPLPSEVVEALRANDLASALAGLHRAAAARRTSLVLHAPLAVRATTDGAIRPECL